MTETYTTVTAKYVALIKAEAERQGITFEVAQERHRVYVIFSSTRAAKEYLSEYRPDLPGTLEGDKEFRRIHEEFSKALDALDDED